MWATDLKADLWNIGHDLFGDTDRFPATFVQGDIFSDEIVTTLIEPLRGKVNVFIVSDAHPSPQMEMLFDVLVGVLVFVVLVQYLAVERTAVRTDVLNRLTG